MLLEHFNDLLKDLGKSVGLPDLKPSSDGLCSLRFDDRVTIDLECSEERGALIFSSIVGTLLPYQAPKVYPELLEANLLWVGTGGATLGVDPATLSVFMCYQEKMEGMEFTRFQDLLKGFSDTALFWNKRLLENLEDGSEAIPPGGVDAAAAPASASNNAPAAPATGNYA